MVTNVLEYLEYIAAGLPEKTALADELCSFTYAEYLGCARRMGTFLAKKLGVTAADAPGLRRSEPVAVLIDRNALSVVSFMAVIYSGNFYVPIDVTMPEERVRLIFEKLQPALVLDARDYCGADGEPVKAAAELKEEYRTLFGAQGDGSDGGRKYVSASEILLDTGCIADDGLLAAIRANRVDLDPLYTLFTSGSTGVPKGATISHRGVIDLVEAFADAFGFDEAQVFGNQAPFDFDVSTKDIYDALRNGSTVQIIPKKLFMLPKPLLAFLKKRRVDTLIWSVSALRIISDFKVLDAVEGPELRYVMLCGEAMPIKSLNYWLRHMPGASIVNLYGPTEITCNCTWFEFKREYGDTELLPVGKAFKNSRVLLLDEEKRLITEKGKVGEICVGGSCLALGYWNDPERTSAAFIDDPFVSAYGAKLYRTGDMAYYNDDMDLVFAARRDFQIKHMGHRIELGEVEAALNASELLDVAVCLYDEPRKKIVCFYQSQCEDTKAIMTELLTRLPKYMCPNVYKRYDRLPLNKNGKIDRQLLKKELE